MTRPDYLFLTICLLLDCVDIVASKTDTTARVRCTIPRPSVYYQALPGIHPSKKVWVIGALEFEESGFRFVAYTGIPDCPQSNFENLYPLNRDFKDIFIAYSEIKSFNGPWGRIILENGKKHKIFGAWGKEWKDTSHEIDARIKKSKTNGGK